MAFSNSRLPAKRYLMHAASLADLQSQSDFYWSKPTSPTASSSSSSTTTEGPTDDPYLSSRNPTPTPSQQVSFNSHSFGLGGATPTKNPFARAMNSGSPSVSPHSSPPSFSPPASLTRSQTPLAPIPIRPIMINPQPTLRFEPTYLPASDGYGPSISPPPVSTSSAESVTDRLPIQFITSELQTQATKKIPKLILKKGWNPLNTKLVMQWAIMQPKTAILFWMCGEVDAWPMAANVYQLADRNIPYREQDLKGIVADPANVVKLQYKVAVKPLPRGGMHEEFPIQSTVPLSILGPIGPRTLTQTKTLVKIKYLDGTDDRIYVRKRLEINQNRAKDKVAILAQIRAFTKLDHNNIAKIISSYAQGSVVAFITPCADSNLEDYLDTFSGRHRSEKILAWVKDLSSALAYIHANKMEHKSIRPQKILVDREDRVFFSVFGVSPPVRNSYVHLYDPYSNDPSYIYAAPEIVAQQEIRHQLADVFSLGCVFFEMVGKAKDQSLEDLRAFRSATTHNNSFHMNLDRVLLMVEHLHTVGLSTSSAHRKLRVDEEAKRILQVTKPMLNADPRLRPSMKAVLAHLTNTSKPQNVAKVQRPRRNSANAQPATPNQSAAWADLSSLQPYYQ